MANQPPQSPSPKARVATSVLLAARVVELADTGGLNPPPRKRVWVRVPPRALRYLYENDGAPATLKVIWSM